jgi:hypothetical protein
MITILVIAFAYTSANPGTMVVKHANAVVAISAMRTSGGPIDVAFTISE